MDKRLDYVGYTNYYNEVVVVGDVSKWDFVAFYSEFGTVVAVAATPSQKHAAQIYAEAFRVSVMPRIKEIQEGRATTESVEQLIRVSNKLTQKKNKSGCYKDPINAIKDNFILSEVIWTNRDTDRYMKNPRETEGYLPGHIDAKGYFEAYK